MVPDGDNGFVAVVRKCIRECCSRWPTPQLETFLIEIPACNRDMSRTLEVAYLFKLLDMLLVFCVWNTRSVLLA